MRLLSFFDSRPCFVKWALTILIGLASLHASATEIVVDFTPYNCLNNAYDTVVNHAPNDQLIIINRASGPGAVQYIRTLNGMVLDTVFSAYGDTLWSAPILNADTLLSIHVLAMPGMCYGQRFHLQPSTGFSLNDQPVLWSVQFGNISVGPISSSGLLRIFDLTGKLIFKSTLPPGVISSLELPNHSVGCVLVVLDMEGESYRRKILMR